MQKFKFHSNVFDLPKDATEEASELSKDLIEQINLKDNQMEKELESL